VRAGIAGSRQLDVLVPRHVDGVETKDVRNRLASIPPAHGLMSRDASPAGEEDPIGKQQDGDVHDSPVAGVLGQWFRLTTGRDERATGSGAAVMASRVG
jgi:hypothetical protein